MRNEGFEVKKKSKINLAGKKGKMLAGENGLKNGPIENGLIQWSREGWMYCTFDLNLLSGPWKSKFLLHSY